MGGWGSGWHRASAPFVERYEKIDLADIKKHRATFAEGEGVSIGSALVTMTYSGLRLRYCARDRGCRRGRSRNDRTARHNLPGLRWPRALPATQRVHLRVLQRGRQGHARSRRLVAGEPATI